MKRILFNTLIAAIVGVLVAACGGNETEQSGDQQTSADDAPQQSTTSQGSQETSSAEADAEAREIVIEANDQIQFNLSSFAVAPGERVRLTLKNVGSMPKFSMGHNVVVLEQGVDPAAFVESAMTAAANDYIPPDSDEKVVAHTKMLGGGEEDSIVFTAPEKTGDYTFLCSFPGHFQLGMKGTMSVQ